MSNDLMIRKVREEIKYYYFEKLDWCGCGSPEKALREIAKYLEGRIADQPLPDDPLALCLAYELDRAGFTDHGSNILHCWLTEAGEQFLGAIRQAEQLGILGAGILSNAV